jgi:myo-inositol 2-dehydrogenase/D-chiro-inositol 1-dehydrogenase
MKSQIVLGMLGAGRIGRVHAKCIKSYIPNARVKSVADAFLNDDMRNWAKAEGIGNITKNPEELIADPEIDAILICSSTNTHADLIKKAVRAGKHIFCEKPVDLDLKTIIETMEIVEKSKVKFQIGFNRRFDHNFAKIREAVVAGAIGVPQVLKITSRDPAPPPMDYVKVSGGLFLDMMIHDFDMARFIMGCEVVSLSASGAVLIDENIGKAGDVDTAIVMLTFENGALGVIDNSRKAVYGYDQRVEVHGPKGCCRTENDTPTRVVLETVDGVGTDKPFHFFLERYFEAYGSEMKHFIESVANDKPIICGVKDAIMPVVMGLAAKKSLIERREVKLSEIY